MYVVPYVLGPIGSPFAKVGVELTDSLYVVLNMRIMTRMGRIALDLLGESGDFNRGLALHPRPRPQAATHMSLSSGQYSLVGGKRIWWQRATQ